MPRCIQVRSSTSKNFSYYLITLCLWQIITNKQIFIQIHFSGNFCEVEPTLCEILDWPCNNGGTCYSSDDINILNIDDNGLGYTCFCPWGYAGQNCEEGMKLKACVKITCMFKSFDKKSS